MTVFIVVAFIALILAVRKAAMALEKISSTAREYVDIIKIQRKEDCQSEVIMQRNLYQQFLVDFPEANDLPSKSSQEEFRLWKANKSISE